MTTGDCSGERIIHSANLLSMLINYELTTLRDIVII